jgi:2-polyprenyl-6-hydroxyphenyl methylase / 3-demethylubiquinone-9 3-methyltransferase
MSNPFHDLASTWWDTNGPFKTLHDINPCRLDYILSHVDLAGKKVLDLGCGGGILSEALAKAGAQVTGIDIEPNLIEVAKNHAQQTSLDINYQVLNLHDLKQKFDVIVCMEMLEHVTNPREIVASMASCLSSGGHVFLSTINRSLKAYFELILMGEYVLKLLPRQTHDYQYFIRPGELDAYLRESGLSLKDLKGMSYNPFSRKATLSRNVDVNYMLCAQKN